MTLSSSVRILVVIGESGRRQSIRAPQTKVMMPKMMKSHYQSDMRIGMNVGVDHAYLPICQTAFDFPNPDRDDIPNDK